MDVNPQCHFYEQEVETTFHILFKCTNAIQFWEKMQATSGVQIVQLINQLTNANWTKLWIDIKCKAFNPYTNWDTIIPHSLWSIWLARNNNHFNSRKMEIPADTLISHAIEYSLLI